MLYLFKFPLRRYLIRVTAYVYICCTHMATATASAHCMQAVAGAAHPIESTIGLGHRSIAGQPMKSCQDSLNVSYGCCFLQCFNAAARSKDAVEPGFSGNAGPAFRTSRYLIALSDLSRTDIDRSTLEPTHDRR